MISGRIGERSLSEPPFLVIFLLTRKMSTISLIVAIIEFQSVFSVLSVAVMRRRLVHCSSTFAALVLPMLGKFVAVFPLTHSSCAIAQKIASFAVSIHPLVALLGL